MSQPLADKLRPVTLDEVAGQRHLIAKNAPLRNIIESGTVPNMIFYGPPGTGKTTVASIIASKTDKKLIKLNGTTASLQDIRDAANQVGTVAAVNGILLYLDEIQYFNKKQQQSLLQYIEDGSITLIASTTENPYFYVCSAVLSRSTVFEFKTVSPDDILPVIDRAFSEMGKELDCGFDIEDGVKKHISYSCGGDVRKAVNTVEMICLSSNVPAKGENRKITMKNAELLGQKTSLRYDKDGDEHYDIVSAYQKSMRGSDANAALHYLARLLDAGDLPSACRRLMVCACEDVGLAYPNIIPIVRSCVETAEAVGLPEAEIPLADAVILVCNSPKSNSGNKAIKRADEDIRKGNYGQIPRNLQNVHFDGEDRKIKGQHYIYPHDYPNHWVYQQYLPDEIKDAVYYIPGENKNEQAAAEYWKKIKGDKNK